MSTLTTTCTHARSRRQRPRADRARELLGAGHGLGRRHRRLPALGAFLGRDLSGGDRPVLFSPRSGIIGLDVAAARAMSNSRPGCCSGWASCSVLRSPRSSPTTPSRPVRSVAGGGATAAFVAASGATATPREEISPHGAPLFWALLGLIVFGIVAIFVSIPNENIIYAIAGLGSSAPSRSSTSTVCAAALRIRRADRRQDLPRHLQRLPARRSTLRRRRSD